MSPARRAVAALALAAAGVVFAGCVTTVRQHPDFETRRGRISRVGVMPPEVVVMRDVLRGQDERLRELECEIADELSLALVAQVAGYGFDAERVAFDERLLADFPDAQFEATQLQKAYENEVSRAYATGGKAQGKAMAYEASLGPAVSAVAEATGVDALLFSQAQGYKRSAGHQAKDLFVGAVTGVYVQAEHVVLVACLVDGVTGDILWCNGISSTDVEADCGSMAKVLFAPLGS